MKTDIWDMKNHFKNRVFKIITDENKDKDNLRDMERAVIKKVMAHIKSGELTLAHLDGCWKAYARRELQKEALDLLRKTLMTFILKKKQADGIAAIMAKSNLD